MSGSGNWKIVLQSSLRRKGLLLAALLLVTACGGSSNAPAGAAGSPHASSGAAGTDVNGTLKSGNFDRSYVLHLPPDSSRLRPTPIVVAFHGFPMTADQMSRITHLSKVADAHGFAVLFPQGYQKSWALPGGSTPAAQAGIDDVAFVRTLLDSAVRLYGLDAMRVVATGISNGGILTELLGCSLSGMLIGIVPVAGLMRRDTAANCAPLRPISVFGIHGIDDPIASYAGVPGAGGFLSFPDTLAFWARVDGCSRTPASSQLAAAGHDGTTVTAMTYTGCTPGTEVVGYAVKGGGHAWPGGEPIGSTEEVGATSEQFDTSDQIWSFLDRRR